MNESFNFDILHKTFCKIFDGIDIIFFKHSLSRYFYLRQLKGVANTVTQGMTFLTHYYTIKMQPHELLHLKRHIKPIKTCLFTYLLTEPKLRSLPKINNSETRPTCLSIVNMKPFLLAQVTENRTQKGLMWGLSLAQFTENKT